MASEIKSPFLSHALMEDRPLCDNCNPRAVNGRGTDVFSLSHRTQEGADLCHASVTHNAR